MRDKVLLQSKNETITQFKSMISSLERALDADVFERRNLLYQIVKLTAEVAELNNYNQHHNKFSFGTRPIATFLEGFIGRIQTDAYVGYRFFAKQNPENEHILCWCHVRAKFKLVFDISKYNDASS